jgi:hypothetical protein
MIDDVNKVMDSRISEIACQFVSLKDSTEERMSGLESNLREVRTALGAEVKTWQIKKGMTKLD